MIDLKDNICRLAFRNKICLYLKNLAVILLLVIFGYWVLDSFMRDSSLRDIHFVLENRGIRPHQTELLLIGIPKGIYQASLNGKKIKEIISPEEKRVILPVNQQEQYQVHISDIRKNKD